MTSTMPGLRLIPATRLWKRSVRSTYSSTLCCKPCVRVRPSQSSEARGNEIGLKLAAGRRHAMLRQILNPSKCSKLEDLSSCRKVANTTAERDMSWMRRSNLYLGAPYPQVNLSDTYNSTDLPGYTAPTRREEQRCPSFRKLVWELVEDRRCGQTAAECCKMFPKN